MPARGCCGPQLPPMMAAVATEPTLIKPAVDVFMMRFRAARGAQCTWCLCGCVGRRVLQRQRKIFFFEKKKKSFCFFKGVTGV
jgi:hypothetical protein